MRLRLGLLRDVASIDRQAAKDAADQAKKSKSDGKGAEAGSSSRDDVDKSKILAKPRIRPLSEAKAIDSGANFISEAFLFLVAGSLIVFESFRSRRKEKDRREDVADRLAQLEESERNARRALAALEREVIAVESGEKHSTGRKHPRILPREIWEQVEKDEILVEEPRGIRAWLGRLTPGWSKSETNPEGGPADEASSTPPTSATTSSPSSALASSSTSSSATSQPTPKRPRADPTFVR